MEPRPSVSGQTATTSSQIRSRRSWCVCRCGCPTGHKNSPTSSSHCGLQEVVSASYPVVDSSLRMIRCSSCLWRYARQSRPVCAPRMFTISSRPSSVQAIRASSGAEGIRTPDLRLAKAALSQLSYGPARRGVGQPGIEPGTSVLSGLRSSRLSYWPQRCGWEKFT